MSPGRTPIVPLAIRAQRRPGSESQPRIDARSRGRSGWLLLAGLLLSGLMLPGRAQAAGTISFLPPVNLDKAGVTCMLATDLDDDGKIDIAATGSDNLSLIYGNGDGTFSDRIDLPLGEGLHDVKAADVNGDGRLDLVLTQNNMAVVLIRQGPRAYAPPVSYPVGSPPCGVTVADFNGDGKPDLAVSNHMSHNMCVLLNRGDGTFAPAVFYSGASYPGEIISTDLNRDGIIDLVVAEIVPGDVLVYFGDGKGRFNEGGHHAVGSYSGQVVAGDFDADGRIDLATSNWMSGSISVLLGDGTGQFAPAVFYPGNIYPAQMASVDLDGDGAPDLVTGNGASNFITVHQNTGDGHFFPPVQFVGGGYDVRPLVVGDFNGDGKPDVATGNGWTNNISVLINSGPDAQPGPHLVVGAVKLDFTSQPAGTTSATQILTLTNTGKLPLTIDSISLTGADAGKFAIVSDSGETTLAPGASRTIQINFTPTAAGNCSAALAIGSNDTRSATPRLVALTGTGTAPAVTLSPGSVTFSSQLVGTSSADQTVTVTNSGPAPLVVSGISITGPNAADYTVADPQGMSIEPGQSRTISLRFTPTARGSRSATLTLASNAPGSPHTVTLSGTGLGPVVSINPGTLSFGSQPVGTTKNTLTVLVQNNGDGPLEIRSVQLTGANPDDFSIVADGWTGAHLLPTQIAILNLVFTPTATGSRSASLTVQDKAPDSPQSLVLSGTGTASAVSLAPASLSFTGQLVGTSSTAQTVTLTNAGDAPLTIHGVHFTGSNAGDFPAATDVSGIVLAPGASRIIPVRFAPTAAGNRSATLAVSTSAADGPQTVALSGTGTAPSVTFGISRLERPTRVSFGDQSVGTTGASQTLIVTNGGTGALTISSVRITGANAADFAVSADSGGSVLAPGKSRQFTLRFKPGTKGSRSASLTLSDNAAGSPHSVALQGVGVMVTPTAPSGLAVKVTSFKAIQLTWVPGSPETTSYAIWRKVGQGEFQRYGGVAGTLTCFVDQHVSPKTTYTYQVRANGPGGISGWSNEAAGTTPLAPPPVAPTGLTVRALSASQMELRWTDTSSDETSFALWRHSGSGAWVRIGGVPGNISRYVDRKLAANTSYSYQVRANGPGGVSGWSNPASGTTLSGPK